MKATARGLLRNRLAHSVRKLRNAKGWSQEALAEAAGLSQVYISNVETAKKAATVDVIEKLSIALSVDARDLLDS